MPANWGDEEVRLESAEQFEGVWMKSSKRRGGEAYRAERG